MQQSSSPRETAYYWSPCSGDKI